MLAYIYPIIYILSQSLVGIIIALIGYNFPPYVVLLVLSTISTIFFGVIERHRLLELYTKLWKHPKQFIYLFSSTGIVWWLVYQLTILSSPGEALILLLIFTALYASLFEKKYFKASLILFNILVLTLISQNITVLVFGLATVAGFFTLIFQKSSYSLGKKYYVNEKQVLAIRFVPFLLILLYITVSHCNEFELNFYYMLLSVIVGLLVLIPTFLTHKCINILGGHTFSYIGMIIPLLTFLFQELILHIHTNIWVYIICILSIISTNYDLFMNYGSRTNNK